MKEEWKEYKLGEICEVINGRAYKQEELLNEGKYRVLRVGNIFQGNNWYYSNLELSEDKYCNKGDLLYAWSCGFAPYIWDGEKTIYHYHIWKLVENPNIVNRIYLYYNLIENTKRFLGGTHGSVMLHLTKKEMEDQVIKLPSLDTQQRIASILKSLDDKIENNRRINENLEQQAQALFEETIMDAKFPRTKILNDYAFINPLRSLSKGTTARYIDMSSLPTKGSFPTNWEQKAYNGGMKFQNGDTIMARITPCLENGKTAYINFLDEAEIAFGSTEYIVLSPHKDFCSELLYFLARYDDFVAYAVSHMNGSSGRQRVSGNDIANYIMPDIPKENIVTFEKRAQVIMEVIKNNSFESRRLAELRDALLPKLMSGEIKVEDVTL